MKNLFLLVGILTAASLSFAQGHRNNNYDGRITINFGNGDNREYIEARFCAGEPAPITNSCILHKSTEGNLTGITNSSGQVLPNVPNESGLSKLQRAISTRFCSLNTSDFCSKTETSSKEYTSCTPNYDKSVKFYVNDVIVDLSTSPSTCTYNNETKSYGNPNHFQDVARSTAILKNLCPNNNL